MNRSSNRKDPILNVNCYFARRYASPNSQRPDSSVITNKNKVKTYKKYGDAIDKRYVKLSLNKLIKNAKKLQR